MAATRTSWALSAVIAAEVPRSPSSAGALASALEAAAKRRSVLPRRTVPPKGTRASDTLAPWYQVPFREPRSRTRTPRFVASTSAWRRETVSSGMTMSTAGSLPATAGASPRRCRDATPRPDSTSQETPPEYA